MRDRTKARTEVVAFLARTDLCIILELSLRKLFFPLSILEYNDTRTVPPREAFCANRHSTNIFPTVSLLGICVHPAWGERGNAKSFAKKASKI